MTLSTLVKKTVVTRVALPATTQGSQKIERPIIRFSSIVAVPEETSMPFATIPYLHNLKFGHHCSRPACSD